jgi:hypothetical protein
MKYRRGTESRLYHCVGSIYGIGFVSSSKKNAKHKVESNKSTSIEQIQEREAIIDVQ